MDASGGSGSGGGGGGVGDASGGSGSGGGGVGDGDAGSPCGGAGLFGGTEELSLPPQAVNKNKSNTLNIANSTRRGILKAWDLGVLLLALAIEELVICSAAVIMGFLAIGFSSIYFNYCEALAQYASAP